MTNDAKRPAYPPAQSVAVTMEAQFHGEPDARAVERIVDAAFWASLRQEEGRSPTISLAYLAPAAAGHSLQFERMLALDPAILTRLAPAVERPGIHLGVWRDGAGGRSRSAASRRPKSIRSSSGAHAISRPRSSCTSSPMRWRWWRRRTGTSRCSRVPRLIDW